MSQASFVIVFVVLGDQLIQILGAFQRPEALSEKCMELGGRWKRPESFGFTRNSRVV
jgi:hypothetical protein